MTANADYGTPSPDDMIHCVCWRTQEAADRDDLDAWVTDGCPIHDVAPNDGSRA